MFVSTINRFIKFRVEACFRWLATIFAKLPLQSSKLFRTGYFDSQPQESLLLTPKGSESFIVSRKDNVIGRRLFASGEFELENFEVMLPLLGEKFQRKCLIDIGANIGVICIPAVKRGHFEKAIAIEPEPRNYSLLVANIHINGLADRVDSKNCALGDGQASVVEMLLCEDNYGDHRVRTDQRSFSKEISSRNTIQVPCFSLDDCLGTIDAASTLIWMDTQGFEGFVLAGATKALRFNPPLVVEFWPHGMNQSGSFPAFKQAIFNAGYQWFYDLSKPLQRQQITPVSFDQLYNDLGQKSQSFTDLLITS